MRIWQRITYNQTMILSLFRKPAPKPLKTAEGAKTPKVPKTIAVKQPAKQKSRPNKLRLERSYPVNGRVLPLAVWENPRAKRLTMRIETGGKAIRVTIPPRLSDRDLDLFIRKHHGWIETQIAKVPQHTLVTAGASIPIHGIAHHILHQPQMRGTTRQVTDEAGNPLLIVHGEAQHCGRRVADFLKKQAKQEILALVQRHCEQVGRPANSVRFKDTTSRWGSCTSKGDLSFSWRIVMAPPEIINYLVAHEVAHLIEMNHGPDFWALCTKLCPDTLTCRAWLKRHGSGLHSFVFTA